MRIFNKCNEYSKQESVIWATSKLNYFGQVSLIYFENEHNISVNIVVKLLLLY